MTVLYADTGQYLLDTFRSMGLGLLLCLMSLPLRGIKSKAAAYFLFPLFGVAAGWLTCFFICGETYCRSPRWFIFLGIAIGWSACGATVLPLVRWVFAAAKRLLLVPLGFLYGILAKLLGPLFGVLLKLRLSLCAVLKKLLGILYNHLRKKHESPRGTPDGTKAHKEPIKAAAAP